MSINRAKVAEIVNRHFLTCGINASLKENSFLEQPINGMIQMGVLRKDDPFEKLLKRVSTDRRRERRLFFHFRTPEIAESILKSYYLHMSHLACQKDDKEFEEFYERTGIWSPKSGFKFFPVDENGEQIAIMSPGRIKETIFNLSLTRELGNPRFWKDYADDGRGCALILEVVYVSHEEDNRHFYELRDVCYDPGDTFNFIPNSQQELIDEIGLRLNLSRAPILASYTKRQSLYDWELESRVIIDYQYINMGYKENPDLHFGCIEGGSATGLGRQYLLMPIVALPFANERHFKIRLRGILWGPNSSALQMKVEDHVKHNYGGIFTTGSELKAIEFINEYKFSEIPEEEGDFGSLLRRKKNGSRRPIVQY
jgi:hypothetical protein